MGKIKILNAWHLKLIMVVLMSLDHIRHIENIIPSDVGFVINIVSRCVAPVFAFLVVEGIIHTSNLIKYIVRLFLFAGITFAGSNILSIFLGRQWLLNTNVLIALAFSSLGIALIIWGKEKKKNILYVLSVICFATGFLFGEWGTIIVPFMVLTYFFQSKSLYKYIGYGIICIIAVLIPFSEPYWFIALPFILLYNGERGLNTIFSKYFFYIFYPVHLWVLATINYFMQL